jgi:hypothetical protein
VSFCSWYHIEPKDACYNDRYPASNYCPKHLLISLKNEIVTCKDPIILCQYEWQYEQVKQYIDRHPELIADFLED